MITDTTFRVVEIRDTHERVLMRGMSAREANAIKTTLASEDTTARFTIRKDK